MDNETTESFIPRFTFRDSSDAQVIDDALFMVGYRLLVMSSGCTAAHSDVEECGYFIRANEIFDMAADVRDAGNVAQTVADIRSL